MNCFVTGGLGFLGSHISMELVRQGHNVTIYDIEPEIPKHLGSCRVINGDVRNYNGLVKGLEGMDIVFHFSGLLGTSELFENPHEAIDTNIKGALNVILACREIGIRKILFPTKPNEWHNVYSVTSQAVGKLGLSYNEFENFDIRILKFWNIYGPYQKIQPVRKAIPLFIIQALENKPIEIYGDGTQYIELVYVKNFAKIAIDFGLHIPKVKNKTYEIHSRHSLTINEIAKTILNLTGSSSEINHISMRKGETSEIVFRKDTNISEILHVAKETHLYEGLEKTISFYKEIPQNDRLQILRYYNYA
ncbi:NAD-dependent epimerase/dehydratase family protein [Flagellimonas sp.]|uniref:NAD-dependent epimerase/dehydratase family protein n=1 Tax=Flagellimonas sp. TaxID=2058762 RepID=UPI003BB14036